jgi:hypothetical protein
VVPARHTGQFCLICKGIARFWPQISSGMWAANDTHRRTSLLFTFDALNVRVA